jgi:hypothetical protein
MPGKAESMICGLASYAGVSISTVSRFVNTQDKVNAERAPREATGRASRRKRHDVSEVTFLAPSVRGTVTITIPERRLR